MDEQLKQLLMDLSKSLHAALAESPEVGRKLSRIRQEGYSVYLLLDANRGGEERIRLADRTEPEPVPVFKIDGRDLSFLRSIGIDPTRQLRRRTSQKPPRTEEQS